MDSKGGKRVLTGLEKMTLQIMNISLFYFTCIWGFYGDYNWMLILRLSIKLIKGFFFFLP